MAQFYVLSYNDRNLVIAADRYQLDGHGGVFDFFKTGVVNPVASVPNNSSIFAIVNEEDLGADFYDAPEDEETDDTCLDCRFEELLGSQEFSNAVEEIVDAVLSYDPEDEFPAPLTIVQVLHDRKKSLGFIAGENFIPCGDRQTAESILRKYKAGDTNWASWPLSKVEFISEETSE